MVKSKRNSLIFTIIISLLSVICIIETIFIGLLLYGKSDESFTEYEWDGGYNYLAIGNSITVHEICSYWWTENGMAATTAENDYFHRVCNYLESVNGELDSKAINFVSWEQEGHDRYQTFSLLRGLINSQLDLITVQLGENVVDASDFESDFSDLIYYLLKFAPHAKLIVLGNIMSSKSGVDLDLSKQIVCEKFNVGYINYKQLNAPEYKCGLGTEVYDSKGDVHIVEHTGVADHPNDEAMKYIANLIINELNF